MRQVILMGCWAGVERIMRQAVKAALVAATLIAPAREAVPATFTVHEPDAEGRVFVDLLGTINDGDFQTFKDKTDQIYPIGPGHPKKQVIVTLISYGGRAEPALQIGDWIRKRRMSTFVPGDRACPEMVVVPKGKFTMGSPYAELQRTSNESQASASIARPFAVGKFAVTRGEFAAFVEETGYSTVGGSWRAPGFAQDDRHPVVCVNWDDAKIFAEWLSSKTGKTYRLLSEAQREYATRAGTTTPFWWGTSTTPSQANYAGNITYAGGGSEGEYRRRTVAVDSFEPNPWGLYNVHGNVREWTEDCWNGSNSGNPGNGDARTTGECGRRATRGGSWDLGPEHVRSASRYGSSTDLRINRVGFRVGREID
jgi:formylglycine-generating enzyme required for sulfatase activity